MVVVVNDNERSYAPTIGGLANHLGTLRTTQGYERFLDWGKNTLARTPYVGGAIYETLHGMKKGIKDIVAPQGMFEDLGLKYIGPIDGHDVDAVESALRRAKAFGGPVIVHVLTRKGEGYEPARADEVHQLHQVNPQTNPETGLPFQVKGTSWTDVFAEEMLKIGNDRPDVVGITAAMLIPVGLHKFAQQYPDRIYDVGIAEQHAATCAAGLAFGGLHPVVAVYATFLNRAFDQVLMDCALHKAGVTFVLDRAGITGPDGASHHGVWDLSILQVVPGIKVAVPRDAAQVRALVREATDIDDGPTVVRFSKGSVGPEIEAVDRVDGVDVLRRAAKPVNEADLLIIAMGPLAGRRAGRGRGTGRRGHRGDRGGPALGQAGQPGPGGPGAHPPGRRDGRGQRPGRRRGRGDQPGDAGRGRAAADEGAGRAAGVPGARRAPGDPGAARPGRPGHRRRGPRPARAAWESG